MLPRTARSQEIASKNWSSQLSKAERSQAETNCIPKIHLVVCIGAHRKSDQINWNTVLSELLAYALDGFAVKHSEG